MKWAVTSPYIEIGFRIFGFWVYRTIARWIIVNNNLVRHDYGHVISLFADAEERGRGLADAYGRGDFFGPAEPSLLGPNAGAAALIRLHAYMNYRFGISHFRHRQFSTYKQLVRKMSWRETGCTYICNSVTDVSKPVGRRLENICQKTAPFAEWRCQPNRR